MGILYFIAQMIGAVLGYRLLQALTPTEVFAQSYGQCGMCQTAPNDRINEVNAFIMEYIATMALISLCCAVWDPRNSKNQDSSPLKFGLAITVLSIIFVSINNGCFYTT